MIHDQKTLYGSWVTSTWLMEELVERLVRWNLHPADIITHRFPLERAGEAYALMASGKCGKVAVCADEELTADLTLRNGGDEAMTESVTSAAFDWERQLSAALLPLFGHRNWIVVADSAYPAQSKPGIETIVAGEDQIRRGAESASTQSPHPATSGQTSTWTRNSALSRERCAGHRRVQAATRRRCCTGRA